ncbi:MAG: hypothetical protein ABEI13_03815, partial [Candidatus Paceibacteria bacterium]
GLGLGTNAAVAMDVRVELPDTPGGLPAGHDGLEQNIIDLGPIFGTLFICYRFALTIWLGWITLETAQKKRDVLSVLIFAYLIPMFLFYQITGTGVLMVYTWIFGGLCLASVRSAHN